MDVLRQARPLACHCPESLPPVSLRGSNATEAIPESFRTSTVGLPRTLRVLAMTGARRTFLPMGAPKVHEVLRGPDLSGQKQSHRSARAHTSQATHRANDRLLRCARNDKSALSLLRARSRWTFLRCACHRLMRHCDRMLPNGQLEEGSGPRFPPPAGLTR